MDAHFEVTRFAKADGVLTKRISLLPDGSIKSDGSACTMQRGSATRYCLRNTHGLAELIGQLGSHEAIALGVLRPDLPEQVELTTKRQLAALNGAAVPHLVARTGDHFVYRSGQPAFALLDFDSKGIPPDVADRLCKVGGFVPALTNVLPDLASTARVHRRSTSAGLSRSDMGAPVPGSDGIHLFVAIEDGDDIERFLKTLHARCWLAGYGWMMVGEGGQKLDRSIVDRTVGRPERLVFEGAPMLQPPLEQDTVSRQPQATDGKLLNTVAACPPLSIVETERYKHLRAREVARIAPECARMRTLFIETQAGRLATRADITRQQAVRIIQSQCDGILLPAAELLFDDPELDGTTVADVLAAPENFVGATMADPLEGITYGRCKAQIMLRADGTPWINSFAHGHTTYELKYDFAAVELALNRATKEAVPDVFVQMVAQAKLDEAEIARLKDIAAARSGVGKRVLDTKLRASQMESLKQRADSERQRRLFERRDPRPQIPAPPPNAPWLPQMQLLNDVLGASTAPEPPMRDLNGTLIEARTRRQPSLHLLTADGANQNDRKETRLPAPEQPLLTRLGENDAAELIERYIDFVDHRGWSVHLNAKFVRHYVVRSDNVLPVVTVVCTAPLVMPDGKLIGGTGLHREIGIIFRVPPELEALLPTRSECTPTATARAMRLLTDEWLCDVATTYVGKCVLIAAALTMLQRLLLPERPAFFITAGQRGGGKTTAAHMLSMATMGLRASAAAWSSDPEERRKALMAYMGDAMPLLVWDNIPRGTTISCPHLEKALTAFSYSDRVLGMSEHRTVPATTVHVFTGNNISPRGDMASRSLTTRIEVDRPDPENRQFKHGDPVAWTDANRGQILAALYTVLLGNPRLANPNGGPAETRFKAWWHLVGSAVEHGAKQHLEHTRALAMDLEAKCPPSALRFRDLFLAADSDDEESGGIAMVLSVLLEKWPEGCEAAAVAKYAAKAEEDSLDFKTALEQVRGRPLKTITATTVSWRLKDIVGSPVSVDGVVRVLRSYPANQATIFKVERSDRRNNVEPMEPMEPLEPFSR